MFTITSARNATEEHGIYFDEVTDAGDVTVKRLFRLCAKEYGRCIGKIYVDTKDGETKAVGWVFQKRERYTDCKDTYIHETWVEVAKEVERIPAQLKVTH